MGVLEVNPVMPSIEYVQWIKERSYMGRIDHPMIVGVCGSKKHHGTHRCLWKIDARGKPELEYEMPIDWLGEHESVTGLACHPELPVAMMHTTDAKRNSIILVQIVSQTQLSNLF